jgi:hypothetical protein
MKDHGNVTQISAHHNTVWQLTDKDKILDISDHTIQSSEKAIRKLSQEAGVSYSTTTKRERE